MATDEQHNKKLNLPLKTRFAISVISTFTDTAQRPDGSINRRFIRFFDFRAPSNPKPINNVSTSDFVVDQSHDLWFRLFTPHVSGDRIPVVIFFHGGGFTFLSPNAHHYDKVCRRFARNLPAYVISVNYRLAPEHRYPAQYDDGFDVLKFLEENHSDVLPENADISRCFLAGDSAGGNIAHNVAIRVCRAPQQFFTVFKLVGLISIQPFFGGEKRTEAEKQLVGAPLVSPDRTDWCWKAMLPEGSNRDHEAVNVGGPNAVDISNLDYPETMVVVAGFDPLKDWQRSYYEWIKLSGKGATLIEYPNMFHAFYIFPELPESTDLINHIKDFVAERVASLSADSVEGVLMGARAVHRSLSALHSEVEAVLWALESLVELRIQEVEVSTDSETVIDEFFRLSSLFRGFSFTFIPRTLNYRADLLARSLRTACDM